MTFTPLPGSSGPGVVASERIAVVAGQTAEHFLNAMECAGRLTDSWQNAALGQLLVDDAISVSLNRLAATRCWGEANQLPSSVFWKTAGPVLEVGWLQNRARTKPLGYAGDYLILAHTAEQICCNHPLGRLFDDHFLRLAAPRAVRERFYHVAGMLAARCLKHDGSVYRVASVGSGPGIDIQTALAALPRSERDKLEVTLLDLDPEALEHASGRILEFLPEARLTCRRENLYRLATNASLAADLTGIDLMVCTGFFDYLRDEVAVDMLRFFWSCLAQGGQMLVGNFALHNPTRAYMEWIGNWYLTYRTADELRSLGRKAGIPEDQFSIQTEHTGVDLFLVAEKTR